MGVKFVGSQDITLASAQAVSSGSPFTSPWFEVNEPNIFKWAGSTSGVGGGETLTLVLEADLGHVGGTQQVAVLDTFQQAGSGGAFDRAVNLGTHPGSRRVRMRATMNAGSATITSAQLQESRSGLG